MVVPPAVIVLARVCVTPTPVSVRLPAPVVAVMLLAPRSSKPVVVMLTAFVVVPPLTEPVMVRPPASIRVNAPPRVTAPRLVIVLALSSVIEPPVLAVSVPELIPVAAVCVSAALMSAPTPSVVVPVAPVVRLPRLAVVALRTVIALAALLVVVSVEVLSWIAPPPPLTAIVLSSALMVRPAATVTPLP